MLAKLLWDPNRDAAELIREFLEGYYGAAAEHVKAYFDVMHDEARRVGFYASYKYHPWGRFSYGPPADADARLLTMPTVAVGWQHLLDAEQAVKDNEELSMRTRVAQLPLLYPALMRWDELRTKSEQAGQTWSLPASQHAAAKQFVTIAREAELLDPSGEKKSAALANILRLAEEPGP